VRDAKGNAASRAGDLAEQLGVPTVSASGDFHASGALASASGAFSGPGGISGSGSVQLGQASVDAHGEAQCGPHGCSASADVSAEANLVSAQGQANAHTALGDAHVEGRATVGANANAHASASIGPSGVNADVHGSAFVGARADVSGSVSNRYMSVEGHAGVSAGAGVEGDAHLSLSGGHLRIGGSLGATLGLGASAGGSVDINVGAMASDLRDAAASKVQAASKWVSSWFSLQELRSAAATKANALKVGLVQGIGLNRVPLPDWSLSELQASHFMQSLNAIENQAVRELSDIFDEMVTNDDELMEFSRALLEVDDPTMAEKLVHSVEHALESEHTHFVMLQQHARVMATKNAVRAARSPLERAGNAARVSGAALSPPTGPELAATDEQ
jgi:hypothetical protein